MKNKPSNIEYGELYQEYMKAIEELEKYKKIEEELGIDLVVLFKALKNGIYTKKGFSSVEKTQICFGNFPTFIYSDCDNDGYLLTDYGKTWALTREELDNGQV